MGYLLFEYCRYNDLRLAFLQSTRQAALTIPDSSLKIPAIAMATKVAARRAMTEPSDDIASRISESWIIAIGPRTRP